jgi:ribosome maturation factor RimP
MAGEEQEIGERVRSLAEPVVARYGADLVDVVIRRGRTNLIRLVADREGGIDLETCARVSEEVSRMLDVEDPMRGTYTLEVTSPGLASPLRTAADFRRHVGKKVRVVVGGPGRTEQHEGTLEEVEGDWVVLQTASGQERIPIDVVAKAKVLLPW